MKFDMGVFVIIKEFLNLGGSPGRIRFHFYEHDQAAMEKYVLSQDDNSSRVLPICKPEGQPLVTRNQSSEGNQKDPACVTCHLCDIEVPRQFINEHYKSDKHKIYTKIADVALERVQKSLHCNIVSDIHEKGSLYFCPQCLVSLNPNDRQSHEKSVLHKKALTVDKFLYDFYVLYANDDGSSDIARKCEETVPVESNIVEPSCGINNISLNTDKNQLMNISKKFEVKSDVKVEETNKQDIESDLLKTDKIDNSNVMKVEKTASFPNKSVIDKASHSDNSEFCAVGQINSHIFCKICKVYVPNNAKNVMSHQKGLKHQQNQLK